MIFALVGNQNSGKTTLFNRLTGSNRHVGNFPGVTVEKKSGSILRQPDISVVDLPGVYSIRPYSLEEKVTRDFLINGEPDGIINIVDATNIERNLYLTLQLTELKIPMVIALNMMDEVAGNGTVIDIISLARALGVPVVPISAAKGDGIDDLIESIYETGKSRLIPTVTDLYKGSVHRCVISICGLVKKHAERSGISAVFAAAKVVEGDKYILDRLGLSVSEKELIEGRILQMEEEYRLDRHSALADMRYRYIESICKKTVIKGENGSKEHERSLKIDALLTNKYIALPLFLLIMLVVFWLTFDVIGKFSGDLLALGIGRVTAAAEKLMLDCKVNSILVSLVIDGIFIGVGSVLKFLPIIVSLFFFLSMLEDSGYMARVAFIMDKPLRKIGLSGRSFVPMLIGFGCSVPAVMATRTLIASRDRKLTILLIPFMSCTAKIPIYAVFTAAFFKDKQGLIMILLYFIGITTGIIFAALLNKTKYRSGNASFIMELPNYRLPALKTTLRLMWDRAKDFLTRAFTVILLTSVVIWFLQSFDLNLNLTSNPSDSLLALLGKVTAPFFKPLGFSDWRVSAALITGLSAKETVISTLSVLIGADIQTSAAALSSFFTLQSAFSFLVFTLLYPPCFAAIAAIHRELGSKLRTAIVITSQCIVAWVTAFIIGRPALLAFFIIVFFIISFVHYIAINRNNKVVPATK